MFEPSDSWLFLAFARADGHVRGEVEMVADYINCSPPNAREFDGAVQRLSAAGLLVEDPPCYRLTAAGKALFQAAGGSSAGPRSQFEVMADLLRKYCP